MLDVLFDESYKVSPAFERYIDKEYLESQCNQIKMNVEEYKKLIPSYLCETKDMLRYEREAVGELCRILSEVFSLVPEDKKQIVYDILEDSCLSDAVLDCIEFD